MFVVSSTKFPTKSFDCISDVIDFLQCYIPFDDNLIEDFNDLFVNCPFSSSCKFVFDDLIFYINILP